MSPNVDYIELDKNPSDALFMEKVIEKQGAFEVNNPLHKAGIVCKISVRRVKYKDENFECLELSVYKIENGKDKFLGVITTDIMSLSKDIYQIALLGSGLVKSDCVRVTEHIEHNFYCLEIRNEEKRKKPCITKSFKVLMEIYNEYLKTADSKTGTDSSKTKADKSRTEDDLWKNYGYDKTRNQFFIPVKDFKEIYENMDVSKEMGITEYKKFLNQNGYSMANHGRNDYTHTDYGKVIALYIEKIKNELDVDNGK